MPTDPVEKMVSTIQSRGTAVDPAATEKTIQLLREMYGLESGLLTQYANFWKRLFVGDFGPSLFAFPTPAIELISQALPWTVGLLSITLVLSWIIGNILGGLTGYFTRFKFLKIIDGIVMFARPIPYYIIAMITIILFVYILGLFPAGGGYAIGGRISFTWKFITNVAQHAILPALSLMVLQIALNHQTMRLLSQGVKDEHYVRYAKIGSVREGTIFARYVLRNALLPQITALTMSIGYIFGGALITEMVFSYPGIGSLLYLSIMNSDYNLLMGITTVSIIAIAAAILIIDLIYPLFDPRIRFK